MTGVPHRHGNLILSTLLLLGVACSPAVSEEPQVRARRLLAATPLIDGHNDLPWALHELGIGDLADLDLNQRQDELMTDMVRLRAAGVGGQFWVCYVPTAATAKGTAAWQAARQIDLIDRLVAAYPETLARAQTAAEIRAAHRQGKVASLMGMEGGHMIENSLAILRNNYRLGVRYMTLTHSDNTDWADSATDEPVHGGLTPFGEEVVREMNRLGMLVDLSHVSDDTMRDVLRLAEAPVIFSHSSARAVADHVRNVPDDILEMVRANGGVVMVNFAPSFVSPEVAVARRGAFAAYKDAMARFPEDRDAREKVMEKFYDEHPAPPATLAQVADHMDHIRHVAGGETVGIGSDFDGIGDVPEGLEDVSKFPDLVVELINRGWSDEEISRALGGNLLRVLAAAEDVAARLQIEKSPSTATLAALDGSPVAVP